MTVRANGKQPFRDAAASQEPRVLSERSRRTYTAAWSLFTDWCAVTDHPELPADPATLIAFLTDCPAAGKTHRGWVDAIDHRHTAHGFDPPGRSVAVLAALGRPTGEPRRTPRAVHRCNDFATRPIGFHYPKVRRAFSNAPGTATVSRDGWILESCLPG